MENVGIVLSIGEAVAQAAGAPLAASLVNEIVKSCEDVARHKVSKQVRNFVLVYLILISFTL